MYLFPIENGYIPAGYVYQRVLQESLLEPTGSENVGFLEDWTTRRLDLSNEKHEVFGVFRGIY